MYRKDTHKNENKNKEEKKKVCSKDKSLCHFICGDEDVDDKRQKCIKHQL